MKKILGILAVSLLLVGWGKGKTVKIECNSLKYGTMEWHYNNKKVSEMYPGKARVYNVEKKSNNGKILAKADGGWTAIVDTISLNVYVAGPYGKYSNTNCITLN